LENPEAIANSKKETAKRTVNVRQPEKTANGHELTRRRAKKEQPQMNADDPGSNANDVVLNLLITGY
jgi:hypothetical protein